MDADREVFAKLDAHEEKYGPLLRFDNPQSASPTALMTTESFSTDPKGAETFVTQHHREGRKGSHLHLSNRNSRQTSSLATREDQKVCGPSSVRTDSATDKTGNRSRDQDKRRCITEGPVQNTAVTPYAASRIGTSKNQPSHERINVRKLSDRDYGAVAVLLCLRHMAE